MAQDFSAAEAELSGFFLSSLGLAAQRYDGHMGGTYDANDAHLAKRTDRHRKDLARFCAVERTYFQLGQETRERMALAYSPHSYSLLLVHVFGRAPSGHFVALAARSNTAREAVENARRPTDPASVLSWLDAQARKGDQGPRRLFPSIMTECERAHRAALAEYEPLRRARLDRERFEKKRAEREDEAAFAMSITSAPEPTSHQRRVSDIADLLRPLVAGLSAG